MRETGMDGPARALANERNLSAPLLMGMLILPQLAVWLFLRRGYRRSLRNAAFLYTAVNLGLGVLGAL